MQSTRDMLVIVAFTAMMVSSTAAWIITDQGEYTANFVEVQDMDAVIDNIQSNYSDGELDDITISFKIHSVSGSYPGSTVMVQLVDDKGMLLVNGSDPTSDFLHALTGVDISRMEQTVTVTIVDRFFDEPLQQLVKGYVISVSSDSPDYSSRRELTQTDDVETKGGFIIYRVSDDRSTPIHRFWEGNSMWGAQESLPSLDHSIRTIRSEYSTNQGDSENAVAAIMQTNGDLSVYHIWDEAWTGLADIAKVPSSSDTRAYDIEYEYTSGEALLVYAKQSNQKALFCKVFYDGVWIEGPSLPVDVRGSKVKYVKMASRKTEESNEVAVLWVDYKKQVQVAVWDGETNTWGVPHRVTSSGYKCPVTATSYRYEPADLAYTSGSGDLVVAVGSYRNMIIHRKTRDTWSPEDDWGPNGVSKIVDWGNIRYIQLREHTVPDSDNLAVVALTDLSGVWMTAYSLNQGEKGYSWQDPFLVDSTVQPASTRALDGAWAPAGARFWLFAGDRVEDALSYKIFEVDASGNLEELNHLGPGIWNTYDFDTTTKKQYQKWVQVGVIQEEGRLVINVLDEDRNIYSVIVPSETTPEETSGYISQYLGKTGSYSNECFDMAVRCIE